MTGKKKIDFELHCSADVISKNLLHNNKTSNQLDVKWEKDTFNLLRPDGLLFFCEMTSGCDSVIWRDKLHKVALRVRIHEKLEQFSIVLDRYMAVAKPFYYLLFMKHHRVIQIISLSWLFPVSLVVRFSSLWHSLKVPLICFLDSDIFFVPRSCQVD